MRYRLALATALFVASTPPQPIVGATDPALPVKDGRAVVATIGDDAIFLDELLMQLEPPVDTTRLQGGTARQAELELLDRLITVRLIAREGGAMGLGDLPEIRKQVDVTSRQLLRDVLMETLVKDLTPDPAAVEARYKDLAREWKTASILFTDEAAAAKAHEAIAAGDAFDAVAGRAVAAGQAKADSDADYHRTSGYLPEIGAALNGLQPGQVSPVVKIPQGFVVVRLVDIRYADDPAARDEARKAVLSDLQQVALTAREEELRAKNVVVDKAVYDGLDFSTGMDALLKDTRVVATIEGGSPLTVAELTDYLRMQFFHGGDPAAQGKRLNTKKEGGLEATLSRRVMNAEAIRLGIDKTARYLDQINAFEESLVFDAFVQKVIVPDSKMREDDVKAYYDGHLAEYSYPGMMRIRGLAFTKRAAAESAVEKLRAGTDFGWLAENADDRADKSAPGLLTFDGRPLMTDGMSEGARKAVDGAKQGEARLFAGPEGLFYALVIQEIVASGPKPYADVRQAIADKLYGEKLRKGVEGYAARLRALSPVQVHLRKID